MNIDITRLAGLLKLLSINLTVTYFIGLISLSLGISFTSEHLASGLIPFGIGSMIYAAMMAMVKDINS